MVDTVPTAPLRNAVREADISMSELARRLGWVKSSRAGRKVLTPDTTKITHTLRQSTIDYNMAVIICRAIPRDPIDLGL